MVVFSSTSTSTVHCYGLWGVYVSVFVIAVRTEIHSMVKVHLVGVASLNTFLANYCTLAISPYILYLQETI